ncbi:MAG: divalent metal cation transporter, partial [Planctomycetota bacterium]
AITLGGGSLAGALYLGVISGYDMLWLQPLAMICGVIMLLSIAYVTMSTQERPLELINENISPVLGMAWLVATIMANIVWCMPQFNLGRAAVQQNLMPSIGDSDPSTWAICGTLFVVALIVNFFYGSGGAGIRIFEVILKIMVAIVVVSFFAVVVMLSSNGQLPWAEIRSGMIPDFGALFRPSGTFSELIASSSNADWWTEKIAGEQRDKIMAAFATAVGINMTFLLPYSLLKKGWGQEHRQMAKVDLSIGLIVPFVLATGCVVLAAASQFHGKTSDVLAEDGTINAKMKGAYTKIFDSIPGVAGDESFGTLKSELKDAQAELAAAEAPDEETLAALNEKVTAAAGAVDARRMEISAALPESDRNLAAMLANRDNFNLANSLAPLAGDFVAQKVFGVGVLGMALSTIIILMLINGFAFCEMFGTPDSRFVHLLGCLIAGVGGIAGPFIWGNADAKAALAIPTSVIGGALIPIAYYTFFLMMNSRRILGEHMPTGFSWFFGNVLMILATSIATFASVWVLWGKASSSNVLLSRVAIGGLVGLAVLFVVGTLGFLAKNVVGDEAEY